MAPVFTERPRRVWAASAARTSGYSGIAQVVRAMGFLRATISARPSRTRDRRAGTDSQTGRRPERTTPRCWPTWTPWSSRQPRAIRTRRVSITHQTSTGRELHSQGCLRAHGRILDEVLAAPPTEVAELFVAAGPA
jgi:hypothetical protein